jgi:RNA polymerase sigma-70 factor (ECF subfamily)
MTDADPTTTLTELDADVRAMLAFQAGDEAGFDQLYRRWRLPVYRFSVRMLGRTGAAEEVAQETFVRVYQARAGYRPTARFRTWLFRIARNLCTNLRARHGFQREQGVVGGTAGVDRRSPAVSPHAVAEGAELARAVEAALAALPERQRAAVVLARYEGCTMAELAEILEISPGGAKALLSRARASLLAQLAPVLDTHHGEVG